MHIPVEIKIENIPKYKNQNIDLYNIFRQSIFIQNQRNVSIPNKLHGIVSNKQVLD